MQTRTAGFNSLDVGQMHDESWVGMDILMFIGGGPAGTAGGIKVTTFAVLFFIMAAELRGRGTVNVFGKQLMARRPPAGHHGRAHRDRRRHVRDDRSHAPHPSSARPGAVRDHLRIRHGRPHDGDHGDPAAPAEIVLVLLMFLGRLGPLTLGSALALRDHEILYSYPKERPAIG